MKKRARRLAFVVYYLFSRICIKIVYWRSYHFGELSYLKKDDYLIWKTAMISMFREYCKAGRRSRAIQRVIRTFALAKIEVIKKSNNTNTRNPIVILCVKNDLNRIRMLVDHYRILGVERFAFMDNGADDGTFEWLDEQPDIDLYRCYEEYRTSVKEGWINRIVSHYGFNRWVILTDSDELMVYEDMERNPIGDLIHYAEKNGIRRIKGLTLDTFSEEGLFRKADNIQKEYCWIDSDGYFEKKERAGLYVITKFFGGPRYRLMKSEITLSKYPLLYFEPGTISESAHYQYPHDIIEDSPCLVGILHYKFLDVDLSEYEKRLQRGSGFTGGKHYKRYLDYVNSSENSNFMYDHSIKFTDSSVLRSISLIRPIDFTHETI